MSTFPLLDEEPPALTTRERLWRLGGVLLALVVLAGAGVGGWVGYGAVTGGSSSSGGGGKVLIINSIKQLALVDPDGSHPEPFTSIGLLGGGSGWVSADGRALLTDEGDTVTLRNGKPLSHSTALYTALAGVGYTCQGVGACYEGGAIVTSAPFADHGSQVVLSTDFNPTRPMNPVGLVPVGGGKPRNLGDAVAYAGDPQQAAAFLSTTAVDPKTRIPNGQEPAFNAIKHAVAGGATTTLVTADQLAKDLDLPADPGISTDLFPDPSGNELAVIAHNARTGAGLGLAVYTRTGRLVAHEMAADEVPTAQVFWSRDGKKLLYSTARGAAVWTAGTIQKLTMPVQAALLDSCAWSPDGKHAVCVGYPGRGKPYDAWVLVDVAQRTAHAYPVAGMPVLWET